MEKILPVLFFHIHTAGAAFFHGEHPSDQQYQSTVRISTESRQTWQ